MGGHGREVRFLHVEHCQPCRVSWGDGHGRACRGYEDPGAVELTFNPSADDINEISLLAAIEL